MLHVTLRNKIKKNNKKNIIYCIILNVTVTLALKPYEH